MRGYMDAVQDENLKKMASYCTEDFFETIDTEKVFENKFTNIITDTIELSENNAEVNVSYDYQKTIERESKSGHSDSIMLLIKVENSWLIDGVTTEEMRMMIYVVEEREVQRAMLSIKVDNRVKSVTPQTTWTNNLSGEIAVGEYTSLSEYLDNADSMKGYYQWDSSGQVYQCVDTSCPDPF